MAFNGIREWVDAVDAGRMHLTTFRKTIASAATVANDFIDTTYFAGNPPANFYASAPLESATVESIRGINLPNVAPAKQFLKSITAMSSAAGATNTSNQNQRHVLCDYLLYYPFIDTDAVGEQQDMIQTVSLPRYQRGGQIMCVSQSAASTVGSFTVSYTNQDGVPGRTSQLTYTKVVAGGGALVSSTTNAVSGSQAFLQLQAGDSDAISIESVNMVSAGGGLMALVIVKPLFHYATTQECRRTTTGNLESYGAATYYETVLMRQPVEIKADAVLGTVSLGNAGSLASSTLVGTLQTIWSK